MPGKSMSAPGQMKKQMGLKNASSIAPGRVNKPAPAQTAGPVRMAAPAAPKAAPVKAAPASKPMPAKAQGTPVRARGKAGAPGQLKKAGAPVRLGAPSRPARPARRRSLSGVSLPKAARPRY